MFRVGTAEGDEVVGGDVARDGGDEEHGGATARAGERPRGGAAEEMDQASELRHGGG